ncbi:MAG: HYR domain-containing protein [Saprospiraceae bacterium]|nr:HYR domain-containing protein [Saprospiraceae bacterium]
MTGTANVTLNVSPAGAGTLQFSTLSLGNGSLPFTGAYFSGIDIPVVATPAAGYVFTGWSDASLPQTNSVNLRLPGNSTLVANFALENSNPCAADVTPPVLVACPTTIVRQTSNACVAVTWIAPTASDNCSTPSVSSNLQSGACFPIGTTAVVYTATDARGNQSNCSFNVVVQQTVTPLSPTTNVCKTYNGVDVNNLCGCALNQFNMYSIRLDPALGSSDCRGTLIQVGNGSVSFEQKANGTATFKGTFRTESWRLVTLDLTLSGGTSTPPAGAPVKAFCMVNQPVTDWFYYTTMTGTYQEGSSNPLRIALEGTPFQVGTGASQQSTTDLGLNMRFRINDDPNRIGVLNMKLTNETIVPCTTVVTGGGTNTDTCDTDTQPPTIQNCPISRILTTTSDCATTTWATPTVVDNCSVPTLLQLGGQPSGACFVVGTHIVTYRASDSRGNLANCNFTVTVQPITVNVANQDISLAVTASSGSYSKFGVTTLTVEARNSGTAPFTNVVIKFPHPTGMNTGGVPVSTLGSWQEWQGGVQVFEWRIPNFPPNVTATLSIPLYVTNNVASSSNFTASLLSSTPTDVLSLNNLSNLTLGLSLTAQRGILGRAVFKPTQLIPIVVHQISPNPTNGDIFMDVESIVEEDITFEVANTLGQVVLIEKVTVTKGQTKVYLDVNKLETGVYFVTPRTKMARNVPTKFSKM